MAIQLSPLGWFCGMTALIKFILDYIVGFYLFLKARKHSIKLLYYASVLFIFAGSYFLGAIIDFLTILGTGRNMNNIFGIHGLLTYLWFGFAIYFATCLIVNILVPQHKKYIIFAVLVLCLIYIVMIILGILPYIEYFIVENPETGEELIHSRLILWTPVFIILSILIGAHFIFSGGGFIKKGIKSTGVIKRKYFSLAAAYILYLIGVIIETLFIPSYILILTRTCIFMTPFLLYFGVSEISAEPKRKPSKKEITVQDGLFRIYKRPEYITEEEVIFHKEQKICLVCKSKVSKLLYVCPECDVLYCIKCYNALSNTENACWVCNNPFDESKPFKPFKKEREAEIEIEKKKI